MLFANEIELAILAMNEEGKIKDGAKDNAQLRLRPETYANVQKNGIRLTRRLELPPGDPSCGSAPAKATAAPSGR